MSISKPDCYWIYNRRSGATDKSYRLQGNEKAIT